MKPYQVSHIATYVAPTTRPTDFGALPEDWVSRTVIEKSQAFPHRTAIFPAERPSHSSASHRRIRCWPSIDAAPSSRASWLPLCSDSWISRVVGKLLEKHPAQSRRHAPRLPFNAASAAASSHSGNAASCRRLRQHAAVASDAQAVRRDRLPQLYGGQRFDQDLVESGGPQLRMQGRASRRRCAPAREW